MRICLNITHPDKLNDRFTALNNINGESMLMEYVIRFSSIKSAFKRYNNGISSQYYIWNIEKRLAGSNTEYKFVGLIKIQKFSDKKAELTVTDSNDTVLLILTFDIDTLRHLDNMKNTIREYIRTAI